MPLRNVAEYLERSAARVPDKTAFSDAAGAVSYRQMLHDAQALGTVLAGLPGCRNAPVAVMIGRTAASVTAMQGVLQSGCYYVPIDEQMPEARMRSILGQVHARAIVHTAANEPQARALADCAPLVSLEEASQHTPDEALLRAEYRYRFEFVDSMGGLDAGGEATPVDGELSCLLPEPWTRAGAAGRCGSAQWRRGRTARRNRWSTPCPPC